MPLIVSSRWVWQLRAPRYIGLLALLVLALQILHVIVNLPRLPEVGNEGDATLSAALQLVQSNACPLVFLAWTTPASTFGPRQRATLRSLLFHHPCANISIWSPTLTAEYVSEWASRVVIRSFTRSDLAELVRGVAAAEQWVLRIPAWENEPYFFSHMTDLLRYALLYRFGGTWSDFDAIYLRSIAEFQNSIGADSNTNCDWCDKPDTYYAPGVLVNWEQGHPVLLCALENFRDYDPLCHNCVGPRGMTECVRRFRSRVRILPKSYMYPISWQQIAQYSGRTVPWQWSRAKERLLTSSYALHLYGFISNPLDIDANSPVGQVLAMFADGGGVCDGQRLAATQRSFDLTDELTILHGVRLCGPDDAWAQVAVAATAGLLATGPRGPWRSELHLTGRVRDLNLKLQLLAMRPTEGFAGCAVELAWRVGLQSGVTELAVRDRRKKITLLSKTLGRRDNLDYLVGSVKAMYPNMPLVLADDGIPNGGSNFSRTPSVQFFELPFDSGLSFSRNFLLQHIATPYVFVCDDDFGFDFVGTDLFYLLDVLVGGNLDIVGLKSPVDQELWGFDFAGSLSVSNGTLFLSGPENRSSLAGDAAGPCKPVDIVPNIFLARTSVLRQLLWDPDLKLGEHEDFFWRAKLAGVQVATCPLAWITHQKARQTVVKQMNSHNRRRVYSFMRKALQKHGLQRLSSFGTIVADVASPEPLEFCAQGFSGAACDRCAAGFMGSHCEACAPGFYGENCVPCACVTGQCADGKSGTGCRCPRPMFGRRCDKWIDRELNLVSNSDLLEVEEERFRHWWPYGSGYVVHPGRLLVENRTVGAAEVRSTAQGGGLGHKLHLNQSAPGLVVVGGWGAALGVGDGPPLGFSLDVDAYYDSAPPSFGNFAPFSPGTHGFDYVEVVLEPELPISYLVVHFLFKDHPGRAAVRLS